MQLKNKFINLIKKYELKIKKENVVFNILGYSKLFLIILVAHFIRLIFVKNFSLNSVTLCFASLLIFVILCVYHYKSGNKIKYLKSLITICNSHIDRIDGNWTSFEDIGEEFIDNEHLYASDLDIVGKKSLFQFLNTTKTWFGRKIFFNDLIKPNYTYAQINERQEAISELSKDIEFANKILYFLSQIGVNSSDENLVKNLKDKSVFCKNKKIKFTLSYFPVLTLISIALIFIFKQSMVTYLVCGLFVVFQIFIWFFNMKKIKKYLEVMLLLPYKLTKYSKSIDILKSKTFKSKKLKDISNQLNTASQALKDLDKISSRMSMRYNVIVWALLNILFLWDYHCALDFEEWKAKYSDIAGTWFIAVGEFESLMCFSYLPNVCNETCLPNVTENIKNIQAKKLGHPLLMNENRVNNDFCLDNNIFIISGSNMSGKTTFLRTVGINLILAQTGSYVCAEKMMCSIFNVVTSMRISDDLNEGVSTFYAELKKIKKILDSAKKYNNTLFLIDEIFRGTNSVDRLSGAETVIKKLDRLSAVGLISTHDLELCKLESEYKRIKNYSFSEYYKNKKIFFDYKLKYGMSTKTNAKYLMEMIGIT